MRIVAEHADRWHVYGSIEKIVEKTEVLKTLCKEIGRDFNEIELTTWYFSNILRQEVNPDEFLKLGIRNIIQLQFGPDWDPQGATPMASFAWQIDYLLFAAMPELTVRGYAVTVARLRCFATTGDLHA